MVNIQYEVLCKRVLGPKHFQNNGTWRGGGMIRNKAVLKSWTAATKLATITDKNDCRRKELKKELLFVACCRQFPKEVRFQRCD